MTGPLGGIRILDLTRLLPGGYATLLLADLGADVVKVEEPGRGDYIRLAPPLVDGESSIHRALNRGKRSIALDLKAPGGAAALRRLAGGADALLESFRPDVLARLGVGFETLSRDHPRLVYCAVTGSGQDGPSRDRVGHDINALGVVGFLAASGRRGSAPVLPPVQVADLGAGMAAALGTAAALLEAQRTGLGRLVDVSMLDVAASWMAVPWAWYLGTGAVPRAGATPLTGGWACYRTYRCADGRFLSVGAIEPRFWRHLCEALGAPELLDRQHDPDQDAVAARLGALFSQRDRDAWVQELADLEACVGPVLEVDEALDEPQLLHRGMVARVEGEPIGPGPAIRVDARRAAIAGAPRLGQHTEEVLLEAGFEAPELEELRGAGAI